MRRAASVSDAAIEPETLQLFRKLRLNGDEQRDRNKLGRVAALAHVLAHMRDHDSSRKAASIAGELSGSDRRLVSELRFKALLRARDDDDILRQFRRLALILERRLDVADLALNILFWDQERTRRDFAFAYYGARYESPDIDAQSTQDANARGGTP